jgi:hypothetical protein
VGWPPGGSFATIGKHLKMQNNISKQPYKGSKLANRGGVFPNIYQTIWNFFIVYGSEKNKPCIY